MMLEERDVRIRCIEEGDLDFVYSCASERVKGVYQGFRFETWTTLLRAYEEDGLWNADGGLLLIEAHNDAVGLAHVNFVRDGLVCVGMVLLPDSRGRGIGSQALHLLCRYLTDNYPIVRIEADTDTENDAAHRMLERVGFVFEGTLRRYRYHHGAYRDYDLYSYLPNEDA